MEPVDNNPVSDWVNDWDWLDDRWGPDAVNIWNSIRDVRPVATTQRCGRAFMPVTHAAISQVARDTETFSSSCFSVNMPGALRLLAPPITADPPDHQRFRQLLLPAFHPNRVKLMEPMLRSTCRELIAEIGAAGSADASLDYARHLPVRGICHLVGLPESEASRYRDWIHRIFQLAPRDNDELERVGREALDFVDQLLADRLENPADDLLTEIATTPWTQTILSRIPTGSFGSGACCSSSLPESTQPGSRSAGRSGIWPNIPRTFAGF